MNRYSSNDRDEIMEYRLEIEEYESRKILHVYMSGAMTDKERVNMGKESTRKCRENNINKLIFDIREADLSYALVDSHRAVLNLSELGMTKNDFAAVIYSHNKEQLEHARNVAYNRGVFNINFFQNLEEGIAWLTSRG